MEHGPQFHETEEPQRLSEIEAIVASPTILRTRAEIKEFVEMPLRPACEILYDKNIQTVASDANQASIERGMASLSLNYGSLSDANKGVAQELVVDGVADISEEAGQKSLNIRFNTQPDSSIVEIQNNAVAIANRFLPQAMTWAPNYTLQEIRTMYGVDPNDEEYGPEAFEDFYYDLENKRFFMSAEHYLKANNQELVE